MECRGCRLCEAPLAATVALSRNPHHFHSICLRIGWHILIYCGARSEVPVAERIILLGPQRGHWGEETPNTSEMMNGAFWPQPVSPQRSVADCGGLYSAVPVK
jgi:hypothetical protein